MAAPMGMPGENWTSRGTVGGGAEREEAKRRPGGRQAVSGLMPAHKERGMREAGGDEGGGADSPRGTDAGRCIFRASVYALALGRAKE